MEFEINLSYDLKPELKLQKYRTALLKAEKNALKELNKKLQKKLLQNLEKYDISSQNILGSIEATLREDEIELVVNCEYAKFLEYGTGVIGGGHPHPMATNESWIYKDDGWWYPTTEDKQAKYPNQPTTIINGQLYAFTKGQKSKPFMYDTWVWAKEAAYKILRKHIEKIEI